MDTMLKYLVLVMRTPHFQRSAIEAHHAFLERLRQQGTLTLSGPFTDKSGGAYLIRAKNLAQANALAFSDPLHLTKSSLITVYEWNVNETKVD
ncbi:MAG: YciI family protein [Gallionella sp.]